MNRRQVLQFVAGTAFAVPGLAFLTPDERLGVARKLHGRVNAKEQASGALDEHRYATVASIAEIILPETDTPGAKSVQVPQFIDLLLAESLLEKDRDLLLAGLGAIDARAHAAHGADFIALTQVQQVALLQELDAAALGPDKPAATSAQAAAGEAERGFAMLKELTLYGYFTSQAVMKNILATPIVPGKFDGCIPVHSV